MEQSKNGIAHTIDWFMTKPLCQIVHEAQSDMGEKINVGGINSPGDLFGAFSSIFGGVDCE